MKKIKKIDIQNFGIYNNFIWDKNVKFSNGKIEYFNDINIIFGRNYSGKTTISRIFRAYETNYLSEKYENPNFKITLCDNTELTNNDITQKKDIRVFNEDFVKENLSFVINPETEIKSFAILGEDNNKLIQEIEKLSNELGTNKENEEKTGLYKLLEEQKSKFDKIQNNYNKEKEELENQLKKKATDKINGIKYSPELYGDQNYTIIKLKADLKTINRKNYTPLNKNEIEIKKKVLKEELKTMPNKIKSDLKFSYYSNKVKELVNKELESSERIEELVQDTLLNDWVKKGKDLHKDKKVCAFCGNPITSERWSKLEKHFNDEVEILYKNLESVLKEIKTELISVDSLYKQFVNYFYTDQTETYNINYSEFNIAINNYKNELNKLILQLNNKKDAIFETNTFKECKDYSNQINEIITNYNSLIEQGIEYGKKLDKKKQEIKELLRLSEVYNFSKLINYNDKIVELTEKEEQKNAQESLVNKINNQIEQKIKAIIEKKRSLNDEQKGAEKVNEFLTNYFGHSSLKLKAVKKEQTNEDNRQLYFEIQRNGQKAYNMSEGECSLVAFCYFMAKLKDVETENLQPIIWIDDPISSLDNNHIFFIYSLLSNEINVGENCTQLFISTHNLDFLKYLKRYKGKGLSTKSAQKSYFLISRDRDNAYIARMPKYMKDYITEFNYLFNEIYKCAQVNTPNDKNYSCLYNFGNNARKFLEIYLYYKYPDSSDERTKQKKFFNSKELPVFLNERITNEYSHLAGGLERGAILLDVPEITKDAKLILRRLKELDNEQYVALINSINEK